MSKVLVADGRNAVLLRTARAIAQAGKKRQPGQRWEDEILDLGDGRLAVREGAAAQAPHGWRKMLGRLKVVDGRTKDEKLKGLVKE